MAAPTPPQSATGVALTAPVFDPYDWAVHEDPYPFYRALRERAPVYYNEERGFWALSRHADVLAAFRDPVRFSNAEGVAVDPVEDAPAVMSFLAMDPPHHGRVRTLVSRGFTPRRVSELEPSIRALATRYIDQFIELREPEVRLQRAGIIGVAQHAGHVGHQEVLRRVERLASA